jgi:hypothetical protein
MRTALLPLLLFVVHGCGEPPLLDLKVVTPEGPDPLEGVDSLRLVVSDPPHETTVSLEDPASFSVELELEVSSAVGTVVLEGTAAQQLVARGETPPIVLRPEDDGLALLVAKAGALSRLRPTLATAGREMVAVLVPAMGVLLAGGLDDAGVPQASASLYDFFEHTLRPLPPLPAPRAGAVGAICGSTCAVVVTGADHAGLATRTLRYDLSGWSAFDDGLSPPDRRRDAAVVLLGDGSYLVAGGVGLAGPLDTVLLLDPGSSVVAPELQVLPGRAQAARVRPAAAAASGGEVLLAGGQRPGEPVAELVYPTSWSFQQLSWPGPAVGGGAAAADLGDGRLAVVGGIADGVPLRDGWIVEPTTLKVTHLPEVLEQGRWGHRIVRLGSQLVVVGGMTDAGLAVCAEVLAAKDLKPLAQPSMQQGREGLVAAHLGRGSFLVAGGSTVLEVYQTAVAEQLP